MSLEYRLQYKVQAKFLLTWPIATNFCIFLFHPIDPNNQKHTAHGNRKPELRCG